MAQEIDKYYSHVWSIQYNTPPNKYLVDYDTKNLLIDHDRVKSWNDLDDKSRKHGSSQGARVLLAAIPNY